MLEIRDLRYTTPPWPSRAPFTLTCSSLSLHEGTINAIIGPNGSGKSTLLRCIAGSLQPQQGSIRLRDQPLSTTRSQHRDLVSWIDVDRAHRLINELLVVDHVAAAMRAESQPCPFLVRNARPEHLPRSGSDALRETIASLLFARVSELSSGQRQSLAIYISFLAVRPLLLIDEGAAHLDASHTDELFHAIRDLCKHSKAIAIFATHDIALVAEEADEVVLVRGGHTTLIDLPRTGPERLSQLHSSVR